MTRDTYVVIIFWSDEDQAFIASVPELSGCVADSARIHAGLRAPGNVMCGRRVSLADRLALETVSSSIHCLRPISRAARLGHTFYGQLL
jgi:hypothetical protein